MFECCVSVELSTENVLRTSIALLDHIHTVVSYEDNYEHASKFRLGCIRLILLLSTLAAISVALEDGVD